MKQWQEPKIWVLGIDNTEAQIGTTGRDCFITDEDKDIFEQMGIPVGS